MQAKYDAERTKGFLLLSSAALIVISDMGLFAYPTIAKVLALLTVAVIGINSLASEK